VAHIEEIDRLGGMAEAIAAGIPKLRIEAAAARIQARIDTGHQTVVGVNRYAPEHADDVPVLKVDNGAVLRSQRDKLARLKAERDAAEVRRTLAVLTTGARGGDNLLALAVDAARAKATVGEISDALEAAFGRHKARPERVAAIYAAEAGDDPLVRRAKSAVAAFRDADGRAPRILIAKMGQDGHDRGQKVVSTAFADFGFDVDVGALFQTPEETADRAVTGDAHAVGVSTLAASHLTLVPALLEELRQRGRPDILVVVGGVIPPEDVPTLLGMGAAAVYLPGSPIPQAAMDLMDRLNEHLGYTQRPAT
jgi:methylmalonyl-CoA mutase